MRKILFISILILITTLFSGCSLVRKNNIQQGNIVTQDMVNQLKPEMTKAQVQFILGTPVLNTTFNNDRWDYVYTNQIGDGPRETQQLSVFFKNNRLANMVSTLKPTEKIPTKP